jgi:hypothetical protein
MLFYLLTFLLPTQIGYHFWPSYAYIFGIRVDYFAPTLYLTDVLVLLIFVLNFRKLKINWGKVFPFILFAVLNIFFSANLSISAYKWLKIFEVAYLAFYFARTNFPKIKIFNMLLISSFFFSLIGIAQVLLGHTVGGPFYLLGERTFNLSTPGISLINFAGRNLLRPYSTFSHPNSLAGFLGVVLILYFAYLPKTRINKIMAGVVGMTFLLTNSLAAFIAMAVALIFHFSKRNFYKPLLVLAIAFSLFLPFIPTTIRFPQEVFLRLSLAAASLKVFLLNPLFGTGLGSFILSSVKIAYPESGVWFLQPVHNIFLLILSEIGVVGFFFAIRFLGKIEDKKFLIVFVFILVSGLFDHYSLTLQQNILLLGLYLGTLSVRKS